MINIPLTSTFKNTGFKQAEKATTTLEKGLKRLALTLGTALSARKIAQFGKASVMAASDLEEAISKVSVVFGRGSAEVEAFGKNSAAALGISSAAAIEAAGTYGNLLQAFGIGQREAQGMSTTLVQLAADMASFNNTSIDQAITALRSGLSGETEPLKRYGVALQDVRLRTEALRLGLIKSTKEALTPGAKAQAAYELILKDTVLAQGDFKRTSDGVANSLKIIAASADNAQAIIGTKLIQSMDLLLDRKDGVQNLANSFETMATNIGDIVLGTSSFLQQLQEIGKLATGGRSFSLEGLRPNIPAIQLFRRALLQGRKDAATLQFKADALARANAKEQGMLASKNLKIQKNTTKELDKQNKLKKDTNKLDKAGSMLDIEKIQIEAALQNNLTDNERLRLRLMKALVNENATAAEILAGKLKDSQSELAKLSNQTFNFKAPSPFDEWEDAILRMQRMLAGLSVPSLNGGSISGGQAGEDGAGSIEILATPKDGLTLIPSLASGDLRELTATEQNIFNVQLTVEGSVITQQDLEKVIVDTVVKASTDGYSTGWYRTTGLLSAI
jgi:hypothetical protein